MVNMDRRCFALSRWDVSPDRTVANLHDHMDSQDAWLFRGKIRTWIDGEFSLGLRGCLSGDTIVKYNRGNRSGTRNISIKELHDAFNGLNVRFKKKNISTYLH